MTTPRSVGAGASRIPVLLYHAVMEEPPGWIAEFTVTPGAFASQLDAIVDSGRTPVPISVLVDHLAGRGPLPERPVVLTFDDGFADLDLHATVPQVVPDLLPRRSPGGRYPRPPTSPPGRWPRGAAVCCRPRR